MLPILIRDPARSVLLLTSIVILFGAITWSGIQTGTDKILPGALSRARDSIAIAQSVLRNHQWTGFAAYMEIVRALNDHGLTLDEAMAARKFGTPDYQSFLYRPEITGAAIAAGRSVEIKNPGNLWLIDGEDTGLASYYLLAFLIFGQSVSSLFYFYLLLLGVTTFAFCVQFWRRPEILALAATFLLSIHALLFITLQIKPDVNSLISSRFLPLLGLLATLQLLLIMIFKSPFRLRNTVPAALQCLVLLLLVHFRASSMWMVLAVLTAGAGLLVLQHVQTKRGTPSATFSVRSIRSVWPACILAVVVAVGTFTFNQLKHPDYKNSRLLTRHVFWHSYVTVLHNNPHRTEVFGIEKTPMLDPRGDGLSYHVFEEYLRTHGMKRADYISSSAERNLLAGVDFRWGPYDQILGLAFREALWKEPAYAAASLFYYQPVTVFKTLAATFVKYSAIVFSGLNIVFLLVIGFLLPRCSDALKIASVLLYTLLFSLLPAMLVAPQELRIMDSFATLLLSAPVLVFLALQSFGPKMLSIARRP